MTTAQAEARLTVQQRFQTARAHSLRLLAKVWNEADHPRAPAGSPDGGQFGEGGGSGAGTTSPKPKGKGKAQKGDFDKAKITISGDKARQDAVIAKWNEKIGEDPAVFKQNFMGGLDGDMNIQAYGITGKFGVNGQITENGKVVGTFTRDIDIDNKSAYSAFFQLNKSATKHDTGKKMLAGNIETYQQLGIEKVTVTANIDVGGYAWAKYGYVPTQDSWDSMRGRLERKLTGESSSGSSSSRPGSSGNSTEADDWSMLSSDVQDDVRDRWMRDSRDEFLSSEEQNWRESGQAKDDAKRELADQFGQYDDSIPEWANEANR